MASRALRVLPLLFEGTAHRSQATILHHFRLRSTISLVGSLFRESTTTPVNDRIHPKGTRLISTKPGVSMASLATTDVCDSNMSLLDTGDLRCLHPGFQIYGQSRSFAGPITTVKVFEDNVLVRAFLETRGEGRVLVVDGGGSMRCALLGGHLGQLAQNNGWAGIVVNGCIRDVDEINACDIGIRALASHPKKSNKKGQGEKHVPVHFGGTLIRDGEWLYADNDGILISKTELSI